MMTSTRRRLAGGSLILWLLCATALIACTKQVEPTPHDTKPSGPFNARVYGVERESWVSRSLHKERRFDLYVEAEGHSVKLPIADQKHVGQPFEIDTDEARRRFAYRPKGGVWRVVYLIDNEQTPLLTSPFQLTKLDWSQVPPPIDVAVESLKQDNNTLDHASAMTVLRQLTLGNEAAFAEALEKTAATRSIKLWRAAWSDLSPSGKARVAKHLARRMKQGVTNAHVASQIMLLVEVDDSTAKDFANMMAFAMDHPSFSRSAHEEALAAGLGKLLKHPHVAGRAACISVAHTFRTESFALLLDDHEYPCPALEQVVLRHACSTELDCLDPRSESKLSCVQAYDEERSKRGLLGMMPGPAIAAMAEKRELGGKQFQRRRDRLHYTIQQAQTPKCGLDLGLEYVGPCYAEPDIVRRIACDKAPETELSHGSPYFEFLVDDQRKRLHRIGRGDWPEKPASRKARTP